MTWFHLMPYKTLCFIGNDIAAALTKENILYILMRTQNLPLIFTVISLRLCISSHRPVYICGPGPFIWNVDLTFSPAMSKRLCPFYRLDMALSCAYIPGEAVPITWISTRWPGGHLHGQTCTWLLGNLFWNDLGWDTYYTRILTPPWLKIFSRFYMRSWSKLMLSQTP